MVIYLILLLPAGFSDLPKNVTGSHIVFCSVLLRMGFTCALSVTRQAVVSYTAFPPLPGEPGGLFLLHWPWSRLHRTLSGTLPREARTFLTCGLSTLAAAIIRQTYVPYHITFIFKCKLFYYPTLKQLPPINSRSMEFCGTFSLLDPRKYPRNLIRYLAVSYSG